MNDKQMKIKLLFDQIENNKVSQCQKNRGGIHWLQLILYQLGTS